MKVFRRNPHKIKWTCEFLVVIWLEMHTQTSSSFRMHYKRIPEVLELSGIVWIFFLSGGETLL